MCFVYVRTTLNAYITGCVFVCLFKVLSAPKNLTLERRSSTSLTFSWSRPEDARSNTTTYTIIHWKGYIRELSMKKGDAWESGEAKVEFSLTGLEPSTSYNVQVSVKGNVLTFYK